MNKKKILGYVIGIISGYIFAHYFLAPFIFKNKASDLPKQNEVIQVLDNEINSLRHQLPLSIGQDSILTTVERKDLNITYTYEIEPKMLAAFSKASKKAELCELMKVNFSVGIQYDYVYKDADGNILLSLPVNEASCSL